MLSDHKTDEKFRFVEDFHAYQEERWQRRLAAARAGVEFDDTPEYPKEVETKFFGKKLLHQIAKVEWRECLVKQIKEKLDSEGLVHEEEVYVKLYEAVMGERGGWLESMDNLSQQGKCWVERDGYVVEGAHVGGDAVIKGGAEIGGEAKVRNKVVVDGPVGIGGYAQVLDEAKVEGKRRMAVYGNAVVSGKAQVLDEAKVYGDAKLWTVGGERWENYVVNHFATTVSWQPPYFAVVKDRARVFGEAVVSGTVADDAMVYGRAEVRGLVEGNAEVGGDAFMDFVSKASGDVVVLTGKTEGEVRGSGVVAYPEFRLGGASTYEMKVEEGMQDAYKELQAWRTKDEKQRDKAEDRDKVQYGGKVRSLRIGDGCTVKDCTFEGDVELNYVTATSSEIKDSSIGPDFRWNGGFVVNSTVKDSRLYYVRMRDCTFEHVLSARDIPVTVDGSELRNCAFLKTCVYMFHCYMKFTTIATITITDEDISDGYVCENSTHAGRLPTWKKWRKLFSSRKPDSDKIPYFEHLQNFYEYVYEFKNQKSLDKAEALWRKTHYWDGQLVDNTTAYTGYFKEFYERALSRRAWLEAYIYWTEQYLATVKITDESDTGGSDSDDDEDDKKKDEEERVDAERARTVYLLGLYLKSIRDLPLARMDGDSFQRVKEAVEKTFESFQEKRFTPYYDFGEITEDPDLVALEQKYMFVFDPDLESVGNVAPIVYQTVIRR